MIQSLVVFRDQLIALDHTGNAWRLDDTSVGWIPLPPLPTVEPHIESDLDIRDRFLEEARKLSMRHYHRACEALKNLPIENVLAMTMNDWASIRNCGEKTASDLFILAASMRGGHQMK